MARHDAQGLFWVDAERELRLKQAGKGTKAKNRKTTPNVKREKPHPFWLEDAYLPGLAEAEALYGVRRITTSEWKEWGRNPKEHPFSWDTECYHDAFMVGFTHIPTGKTDWVQLDEQHPQFDSAKVAWILRTFTMYGFNSERYDATMIALALGGCDNEVLKMASDAMIVDGKYHMEILKQYRCSRVQFATHVDLQDIAPGIHSLKTYAARLGAKRLQDLPFDPGTLLGPHRRQIVLHYMCNDGDLTTVLANKLEGEVKLRASMSQQYGVNLLSASDAKIAETVLQTMYERKTRKAATKPTGEFAYEVGQAFKYKVPSYLQYRSQTMKDVLAMVRDQWFVVGSSGSIDLPKELKDFKIKLGDSTYKLGVGGLHSTEKSIAHLIADDSEIMEDADVASYYPRIILNQRLFPKHLGPELLEVYEEIVNTRLARKKAGDKVGADSLKIVINSSFGKFGNKHSVLYAPDFVMQITLTGQLSLLMLIDALESVGIRVVSANTDGVVSICPRDKIDLRNRIYKWWQKECGFELEYAQYTKLCSRDVNNYFAVSEDSEGNPKVKRKGAYAKESLSTTPNANICADAVEDFLKDGTPLEDTIRACTNMQKFAIVRNVSGGAVWRDQYLGKVCRWYYSNAADRDLIVYAKSGNRVAQSDDCRPMEIMLDAVPDDLDYTAYVDIALDILADIGL